MLKIQKKHIPNILLISRMFLALVVFILFVLITCNQDKIVVYNLWSKYHWQHNTLFLVIAILFTIASITDWLDGYLARKYKWVSNFGKLWDPIADKVLINITLLGLMMIGYIPWWIVVVMIVRDVVVDASRMYAASQGRVIAADIYGKLKTIFQMAGIIVILFLFNETPQAKSFQYGDCSIYYWTIQNGLLFIATFMSILSGINYIIKIYRPFNKSHK